MLKTLVRKIVGEKHLHDPRQDPGIVSWTLFGAAITFDGRKWDYGRWQAQAHLPNGVGAST